MITNIDYVELPERASYAECTAYRFRCRVDGRLFGGIIHVSNEMKRASEFGQYIRDYILLLANKNGGSEQ